MKYRRRKVRRNITDRKIKPQAVEKTIQITPASKDGPGSDERKWPDEMKSKKVRLDKMMQKDARLENNAIFQRNEGKFYQKTGGETHQTGVVPHMNKLTEF